MTFIQRWQRFDVMGKGLLWPFYALAMILICTVLLRPAQAQTVTIQNALFQSFNPLNQPPGNWNEGPVPSWTSTGSMIGSWQPGTNAFNSLPNGPTVVYVYQGNIKQDLGVAVSSNGTYTLTALTGHRADNTQDDTSSWVISLYAGSTQLCTNSGPISAIPSGTFVQQSLACPIASAPAGDLIVQLSEAGTEAVFAGVSLAFNSGHSVTLNWTASTTQGVTYNVYRSNGAAWNPVLLANVATTSYVDNTIVLGNNYVYKVTATLAGVESDFPSPVTVVTQ